MASQGGTSRLAQMQIRFQQKQQQEREQRKIEMIGDRTITQTAEVKSLNSTMGTGKVRQMFDERRQRGTGIDKSYPLKPIASRTTSGPTVATTKTVSSTTARKHQSTTIRQANSRTSSSETTLVTKKNTLPNGNTPTAVKGNLSARTTADNIILSEHNEKLPNMEQLSLDDNKNVNGYASGDKNNNNNSKHNNPSSVTSTIKLKPVVMKKTVPEPKSQKRTEEGSLSSSSSRLLSPASDKSGPTRMSPKTIAKPTTTSESRMAAATQKPPPSTLAENMAVCRICNRHFNVDRIEKHQQICEKSATKKRKVFDASKHRVKGTEAEQYVRRVIKSSGTKAAPTKSVDVSKKSNWRKKHEEFIQAIRAAKEMKAYLAKGGKLSDLPPPPPSENPDYIQCPHCKRRFNEAAATRHIPKCASMLHNKPKPGAQQKRGAKR